RRWNGTFAIATKRAGTRLGGDPFLRPTERSPVCRTCRRKLQFCKRMRATKKWVAFACWSVILALVFFDATNASGHRAPKNSSPKVSVRKPRQTSGRDDSVSLKPASDLALRAEGLHKADALAHFVEGVACEENGEMERALEAYRKVLNVDPGYSQLASRVA